MSKEPSVHELINSDLTIYVVSEWYNGNHKDDWQSYFEKNGFTFYDVDIMVDLDTGDNWYQGQVKIEKSKVIHDLPAFRVKPIEYKPSLIKRIWKWITK